MTSQGTSIALAATAGPLAGALIGSNSIHMHKGYTATTPQHQDDIVDIQPIDSVTPAWGSTVRFAMPKNSTLIDKATLVLDIGAGVLGGGRSAAYVNNLGDQILGEVALRYGSTVLQTYPGLFQKMWRRLTKHDNHIEGVNGQILGGLPPGAPTETTRSAAVTAATRVYIPLEELYFVHNRDEAWMTEAHALEGELHITLNQLGQLVYSDNGADPFTTQPAITNAFLRYREITVSAPEKEQMLSLYRQPQGVVQKFLDLERQENFTVQGLGGGARTIRVPLDNFRMDMAEIMFCARIGTDTTATNPAVANNWAGDGFESDTTVSTITAASVATLLSITSFRVESNGKILWQSQEEAWNRLAVRERYHPDCQIADPFYIVPIAAFPEDRKNATGHLSGSVLGKLELVVTMPDVAATQAIRFDVFAHSHNFLQHRSGGVAKALH